MESPTQLPRPATFSIIDPLITSNLHIILWLANFLKKLTIICKRSNTFAIEQPLEAREKMMKVNEEMLMQLRADLSIDAPFVKGKNNLVKNCWHFYSDGNSISTLFYDEKDFIDGMNRIFVVYTRHPIVILAFCLMDTHVHFILYGNFFNNHANLNLSCNILLGGPKMI